MTRDPAVNEEVEEEAEGEEEGTLGLEGEVGNTGPLLFNVEEVGDAASGREASPGKTGVDLEVAST